MKEEVCQRFAQALTAAGLTQAEMSRLIGKDPPTVNRVTRGKQWPSFDMLAVLVERGVSADWVVSGRGAAVVQADDVREIAILARDVVLLGGPKAAGRIEGYLERLYEEYSNRANARSA